MAGRITLTGDQALDVFFVVVSRLHNDPGGTLDPNQVDALRSLAAKLDFQAGTAADSPYTRELDEALTAATSTVPPPPPTRSRPR